MADGMATGFADLPDTALTEFQNKVGVTFEYGDWNPEVWFHVWYCSELELCSIY